MLIQLEMDPRQHNLTFNELAALVGLRYANGGEEQEHRETFRVFDQKERGNTTAIDIKRALRQFKIPVYDGEIEEVLGHYKIDPCLLYTSDAADE